MARSRELASQHPELNLMFVEGSFTSLPEVIASARFTHIFSAAAFASDECCAATFIDIACFQIAGLFSLFLWQGR